MADQSGKTAWITGASSGIGEALAKAVCRDGGNAILSGRNVAALDVSRRTPERQDRCLILPFDTMDFAALPARSRPRLAFAAVSMCWSTMPGFRSGRWRLILHLTVYERIVDVDLLAPIALTQALLPHLVGARRGQLVMISSVAGKAGVPLRTAYCAAKHGLIGYADCAAQRSCRAGREGAGGGARFRAHQCLAQRAGRRRLSARGERQSH